VISTLLFVRVELERKPGEPLLQIVEEPRRIAPTLETHDRVVGIAHNAATEAGNNIASPPACQSE
jgi:hypothetical protein